MMSMQFNPSMPASIGTRRTLPVVVGLITLACTTGVQAFQIDSSNPDIRMTWDNTIKYSLGYRLKDADPDVADNSIGPQGNTNDGDLNFDKGLISNRLDILSQFNLSYKRKYGLRLSGAAWYDDVYHRDTDNPGALVNSRSVDYTQFTDATKDLHGGDAEILDAFTYGNFNVGGKSLNLKLGRFTQLYGESLFFGSNGIAAAQTSLDLVKALSVPNSQFQEILRPVGQLSGQLQLSPDLSIGGYYQFEWRKSRIPGAGSYFSFADFVDEGGESMILAPGQVVYRGEDIEPSDSGQFGMQVRFATDNVEYGLYAAQYHDKMPQFYARPGVNVQPGSVGDYMQVFGEDIRTVGASFSTLVGETNVAGELSFRDNQPLVASGNAVITNALSDGGDNAAYPVGRTMHLNLSMISVLPESALWDGATFIGEFAYNRRLSISDNADQLDPSATRSASALQFVFTPEYFQVLPGLDLKTPIGVGYGLSGRSSVSGVLFPSEGGGNISLGLTADYQRTWQAALNYTHYIGSAGSIIKYNTAVPELSYDNFHGDRDFISLSIQRTF
ncbi:hypothetical protein ABIE61_003375 [Marinobacterium sp. MBR-111]|jgi:hypothetical protein|uniref:DUF1302 domain-containing protein n=1 Tax=Marinobacterium sp. MBR-111 TaxID=3156463 RepID=UPI003396851B